MATICELISEQHAIELTTALQARLQAVKPTDKGGKWGDNVDIAITGLMNFNEIQRRRFRVMIAGQSDITLSTGESVEVGANGKSLIFAEDFGDCSLAMDLLIYVCVPYNLQTKIIDYWRDGFIAGDMALQCLRDIVDYTVIIHKSDFFNWIDTAEQYYAANNSRSKKLLRVVKSSARSVNSYYQIRGETDSALQALYNAGVEVSRYTYTGYNLYSLKSYIELNS